MIQYNSADLEGYNEVERAKIAIQEKLKGNYQLGMFYTDDSISISRESRIWYSYDEARYNFHIVPDKKTKVQNTEKTLSEWLRKKLDAIIKELPNIKKTTYKKGTLKVDNKEYLWARSEGRECTINHKWISIIDEKSKYEYLLLPFRLWHEGNYVNNSFGKIQFMRYPIADEQINLVNGQFEMMYPASDEDGKKSDEIKGHFVCNPEGLTIKSKPEEIAKKFIEFIEGKLG